MAVFFIFLLSCFTFPFLLNNKSEIYNSNVCEVDHRGEEYKSYAKEGYKFGRKIQKLVFRKDLEGIYNNVLNEELRNGPRKAFVKDKNFDEIFPNEWSSKIVSSKLPCGPVGWRGFMLSNGKIWFDRNRSGDWSIVSINQANQEEFKDKNISGWITEKGLIHPTCFPRIGYYKTPKLNKFAKKFNINNERDFKSSPGKYIGKTIPLGHKFVPNNINEENNNRILSITKNLNNCFNFSLNKGFSKNRTKTTDTISIDNIIYQTGNEQNVYKNNRDHLLKVHYRVFEKVELSKCNKLAPQLTSECRDSYLIKLGYHSGGTAGWLGFYYIFGIFEDENKEEHIVPLRIFSNRNLALNELRG